MGYAGNPDLPDDLHPDLKQLVDYWQNLVSELGRLPARADIELLDFPKTLPRFIILEILQEDGRQRYRFRYCGSQHTLLHHHELTGQYVDELYTEESIREADACFRHIAETRLPHYWRRKMQSSGYPAAGYQRVYCPLATDGCTVDMLIGIWVYDISRPLSRTPGTIQSDSKITNQSLDC